jgi:Domain of unknown function (DUF4159)
MTRRKFMRLLTTGGTAGVALNPLLSWAGNVRGPQLPWVRLKFPGPGGSGYGWDAALEGDSNLMDAIREQTSANMSKQQFVADVASLESMTQFPFLFMHSNYAPDLDDAHRANLREYLLRGGFLFAEDCINSASLGDDFFRSMAEVHFPKMFPEAKVELLPYDHRVFHCFHNFSNGLPHMQGVAHGLHGVSLNGRLMALLSPSDIHCGWTNGDVWFGHAKRVQAIQMGINIYLYALTEGNMVNAQPVSVDQPSKVASPPPPK